MARFLVAVTAAIVAVLLHVVIDSLGGGQAVWLCFTLGVVFSAWYGGLKPGMITATLLLIAGLYFSFSAPGAEGSGSPVPSAILFTLGALAICSAMQRLRMEQFRAQMAGARLHDVLESTQDAVFSVDNDFRCLYANDRAGQIGKKPPSLIYGKSLRTIFPETPAVNIYKELSRVLRERSTAHFEDSTGTPPRWYEFDAYSAASGLNLFVRDITDRKRIEAERATMIRALESEHLKLESVLREMPVGVIIASADMRVQMVNPAVEGLFATAIRRGDDLTVKRKGIMRTLEGAVIDPNNYPIQRALDTGERIANQEVEYTRPDGEKVTMIINARPLTGPEGQVTGALGTYLDITSIRQMQKALITSERSMRLLFDSPIIGIVTGDEEKLTEANDACLRMLGYTRDELNSGSLTWTELTPPEYRDVDARALRQLTERGFCDPIEKEVIAKDGRRVAVMAGTASCTREHWSPWISWLLDVSDRRKLESRLREAGKLESIGLLAGGIAHDFNNILTSVMGNASLAYESLPSGHQARGLIENAIRGTERAADLTRQLLAYAGKGQFVVRPLDVSSLASEISQLIRSSIPRNVELELRLASGLPAVDADATQLQQLIMNLVINGAEAVGEQAGKVRVLTETVHVTTDWLLAQQLDPDLAPGEYVSIEVQDNGCGMEIDTARRIFDPFFTTKFTGRGLGLAAATGIVRAHKGTIKVRSMPGAGSIFQVLLPVSKSAAGQSSSDTGLMSPSQGSGTILVVDDEEIVRDVAKSALERYGYTVLTASNGQEALDLYRGLSYSISMVILDMTMPKMSGEETLGNLMVINPGARVLLTSGFDQTETVRKLSNKPLAGFLQKPYTSAVLAKKVREVLDTPQVTG